MNDLIDLLRASGLDCHVGQIYFGIVAYADDILLLAPRREALRRMVWISENFMDQQKISFSSTKTKCLHIGERKESINKVVVAGCDMEWSNHVVHLCITLSDDGSMEQDIKLKRAFFIDEGEIQREEFRKILFKLR